jgi:hypothetical protein
MQIAIVEYGGKLADIFEKTISEKVADAGFEKKRALDLFDVLALARQMADREQLVIIAYLDPDEPEQRSAFYDGLATLEADTGKNIFKCLYSEHGEAEIEKLVEDFINYIYYPEKLEEEKEEEFGFLEEAPSHPPGPPEGPI